MCDPCSELIQNRLISKQPFLEIIRLDMPGAIIQILHGFARRHQIIKFQLVIGGPTEYNDLIKFDLVQFDLEHLNGNLVLRQIKD